MSVNKNYRISDFPEAMKRKDKLKVIAVDYDGTITADIPSWTKAINAWEAAGFFVVIVTMRFKSEKLIGVDMAMPVIYTGRKGKKTFCDALGITPDIWCDDNPQFIFQDVWLGVENAGHLNQWDHPDYDAERTTKEDVALWPTA